MTLPRARVVRAEAAGAARRLFEAGPGAAQRRRVAREELQARLTAEGLLREAREDADATRRAARDEAAAAAERVGRAAREEAEAELAARWIRLRAAEVERTTQGADGVLGVAVVLAERLLGAALEVAPSRIADVARTVLAEARGARRASIEAHPADAEALREHVSRGGIALDSVDVRANGSLARGELLLHTDVGTIDAKLAPRLERLAEALRNAVE